MMLLIVWLSSLGVGYAAAEVIRHLRDKRRNRVRGGYLLDVDMFEARIGTAQRESILPGSRSTGAPNGLMLEFAPRDERYGPSPVLLYVEANAAAEFSNRLLRAAGDVVRKDLDT